MKTEAYLPENGRYPQSSHHEMLTSTVADWQTELALGNISDDDKASLVKWMNYIKALNTLDFSEKTRPPDCCEGGLHYHSNNYWLVSPARQALKYPPGLPTPCIFSIRRATLSHYLLSSITASCSFT